MASTSSPFPLAPPRAIFQQRRVDVLVSLQKAGHQITSILELDELLDTIVHRVAVDFGCIESSILLVDGYEFHLAAVHGCTQSKKGERWPVTEGLSAQVVVTGKAYYAPDVTQELLYRACEPHIRSEVIIPLKVRDRIIGVFGASHHDVDAFPRAQIEILKALAAHIAVAVDNAQRVQQERRQMQRLHEEQDEAHRIQQNLLPRSAPSLSGFQLEAECVPAGAVGGDWYDYIPLADGRLALVLADVSGKGMPAAFAGRPRHRAFLGAFGQRPERSAGTRQSDVTRRFSHRTLRDHDLCAVLVCAARIEGAVPEYATYVFDPGTLVENERSRQMYSETKSQP